MKKQRLISIILISTGFLLSPLTWWNDLVVNVPLAYIFAIPFSLINEKLFLPAFVFGYWLTNLAGLLLMHWGAEGIVRNRKVQPGLKHSLLISIVYTLIIILMVSFGWLAPPSKYLAMFS
jgi:hypothetical protein